MPVWVQVLARAQRGEPAVVRAGYWGNALVPVPNDSLFPELAWRAPARAPSWKALRDAENSAALGGQRNPRTALTLLPGLRPAGRRLQPRWVLHQQR